MNAVQERMGEMFGSRKTKRQESDKKTIEQRFRALPGQKFTHSRAYHRYYEGYCEKKVEKPNGSFTIERVYTGNYYRQDVTDSQRTCIRAAYWLLYAFGLILFIYGGTQAVGSNLFLGTIAAQMVTVCLLIWMFFLLISYVAAKREMEIRVYRETSGKLQTCAKFLVISTLASAAASLLYMIVWSSQPLQELYCLLPNLGAGAVFFLLRQIESGIPYTTRPSEHQPEPGQIPIEY